MQKGLRLPAREKKPRSKGITHVLDKGLGVRAIEDLLETCKESIDIVKLGWGTALVTENLKTKIALYRHYDIPVTFGGTLFEVFLAQDRLDDYLRLLDEYDIKHVEISNGVIDLSLEEKVALIRRLSKNFTVISEVGSKDVNVVMAPYKWVEQIKAELKAGAWKVITEGRESGTVGVYRETGEIRTGLIDEIISQVRPDDIVFEAPNKKQQVWFIEQFGSDVNLGNIAPSEVIALETLRLGLRGDTLARFHAHGKKVSSASSKKHPGAHHEQGALAKKTL